MEFRELIDKENLELDCKLLRRASVSYAIGEDIDNLVCDTIDRLADEGMIKYTESIDLAYYIANEIKRKFIL